MIDVNVKLVHQINLTLFRCNPVYFVKLNKIHVDLPKFKGVPYHMTEINNKDFQIAHCNIKDWKRYTDWKPKTNRDINF